MSLIKSSKVVGKQLIGQKMKRYTSFSILFSVATFWYFETNIHSSRQEGSSKSFAFARFVTRMPHQRKKRHVPQMPKHFHETHRMVTANCGHDLTDGMQNDMSHENHSAGMPLPCCLTISAASCSKKMIGAGVAIMAAWWAKACLQYFLLWNLHWVNCLILLHPH